MPCPIHGGDNQTGLWWSKCTNHWQCETRHCEQDNITGKSSSIFGLIRGILSKQYQKQVSFRKTIYYIKKILPLLVYTKPIQYNKDNIITNNIKYPTLEEHKKYYKYDEKYYPKRGISEEIIKRYYISICNKKGKAFYNRIYFPILDNTGKFVVGYSSRSIYEKCEKCLKYHNPNHDCKFYTKTKKGYKWIHSRGFKKTLFLYNLWYSKIYIKKSKTCIVCEGPADCWRYESSGIRNSVAILGTSISRTQIELLKTYNTKNIILTLDNDVAGIAAREKIIEKYGEEFNIRYISLPKNDICDMSEKEILELKL